MLYVGGDEEPVHGKPRTRMVAARTRIVGWDNMVSSRRMGPLTSSQRIDCEKRRVPYRVASCSVGIPMGLVKSSHT